MPRKVTVAQFGKVLSYLPLYFAQREGIFEKAGLEVHIVDALGDHAAWDMVRKGEAHFGIADPLLMVDSSDARGVVVAALVQRAGLYGLSRRSPTIIKSASDFSGKTVAAFRAPSTCNAFLMHVCRVCEKGGLAPPQVVEFDFSAEFGYLNREDIDMVLMTEPAASLAEQDGAQRIFYGAPFFGDILITGAFSRLDYVRANCDTVQRFVSAIETALRRIHTDHLEAVRVARNEFAEVAPLTIELATMRLFADGTWPKHTAVSEASWYGLRQIRAEGLPPPVAIDYITNEYAVRAMAQPNPWKEMVKVETPKIWGISVDLKAVGRNLETYWRNRSGRR